MTAPRLTKIVVLALVVALAPAAASAEERSLRIITDGPLADDPDVGAYLLTEAAGGARVFVHTTQVFAGSDTDASEDAYVRVGAGPFVNLTDSPFGADGPFDADFRGSSSDGTRVVFETREPLAATDTDSAYDLYERLPSGALVHVSDGTGSDAGIRISFHGISPDGTRVVFSTTEPLLGSDNDTAYDVYEHGPSGLRLLSDATAGMDAPLDAGGIALSADGLVVYFQTNERLADTDTDDSADLYARTASGALIHISDDGNALDAGEDAYFFAERGARVWFGTRERLAPTDTDLSADIYERGPTGALTHVTDDPTGPDGDWDASVAEVSADGSRVAFETSESMAASDGDTATDVYERQPNGALVDVSDDPARPNADVPAFLRGMSRDGSRVLFATAERLAATDADTAYDGYLRTAGGALVHVTDNPARPDGEYDPRDLVVTPDGARVAFVTQERLLPADTDVAADVYERGPSGLRLLSDGRAATDPDADAILYDVSPDGRRVYFATTEPLVAADTDAAEDGYLSTLVTPRPATPAPDRTPPRLSGLRVRRRTLRFVLSEPARVRVSGRRVRRVSLAGETGVNRARLRVKGRGRYRLTITATDRSGNRSVRRLKVRIGR